MLQRLRALLELDIDLADLEGRSRAHEARIAEAVRLDPSNPRSLLGLAEALAARGDYEIAIDTLDRARKLPLTEDLAKEIFARRAAYLKLKK